MHQGVKYRPEIDGLRAISVISVILFHTHLGIATGGYVGVDIFFVISGYLISSIIMKDVEGGRFSFVAFYDRRIRRIFPAQFVVLLVTTLFSFFLLSPKQLLIYSQSLISTSVFCANIFFWLKSGYFGGDAEQFPLVHMWSLAVEEQFYIFFPLIAIVGLWNKGRLLLPIMGVVFVVSLAACVFYTATQPLAAFFLTPMRAWELLAGFFVSRYEGKARLWTGKVPSLTPVLELVSVALMVVPMVVYDDATPFPGYAATAPVLGAALFIALASPVSVTGRFFSSRPVVGVGLISYSAYLWHQPLFALARAASDTPPQWWIYLALTGAALGLSWLSLKIVEEPFRRQGGFTRRQIYIFFAVGSIVLLAIGGVGQVFKGFPNRFSAATRALDATSAPSPLRDRCHVDGLNAPGPDRACRYFTADDHWAVLGDSHGVEMAYALAEALKPSGQGLIHMTFSGCQAALTFQSSNPGCSAWMGKSVAWLVAHPEITDVLVVFRHDFYLFGDQTKSYPRVPDEAPNFLRGLPRDDARNAYVASFSEIVRRLAAAGKRVHIVKPVPELPTNIEHYDFRLSSAETGNAVGAPRSYQRERSAYISAEIDRLGSMPGVSILDPQPILCPTSNCWAIMNGKSMYFDDNHLSVSGARFFINSEIARHALILGGTEPPKPAAVATDQNGSPKP
jgi:peptidoglycan/LPS O-acetylase OafA/YrhL